MSQGSTTDLPERRYAWFVVGVLMAAYTLSFVDRQIIALLVGPIKRDLQISDFEISLLQGFAFAILYTVLGIPFGRLADRRSRRALISIGIFVWSLMTVVCGLVRSFSGLFLARIGVGVGEATLSPSAYSMISDYFPRDMQSRALGVYFMGVYIGSGLAYIFGGWIVEIVEAAGGVTLPLVGHLASWQAAFVAVGLPGLIFVAVMAFVKEPARRGRMRVTGTVSLNEAIAYLWQRKRLYLPLFLGFGMQSMFGYGIGAWVPEMYVRLHDMGRGEIGMLYGLILMLGASLGVWFSTRLADKQEALGKAEAKLTIVIIGNIVLVPLALAFTLAGNVTASLIFLALATFVNGFPFGLAAAAIQRVTPNDMRGLTSAVYLFIINLIGLGMGPSVVAAFTDFVFADPDKLHWSLAATSAVSIPLATFFLMLALRPFSAAVEESHSWANRQA